MNYFCNPLYFSNSDIGVELTEDGMTPKRVGVI